MKKRTQPAKPIIVDTYPMRINKYLAHKGVATRTGVDEIIKSGKVLINGRRAKLGDKVLETDKVEVLGSRKKKQFAYFAYNKPEGVVSTNPQGNEKSVMDMVSLPIKCFPIGRLDKESHGLLILTNDGRVTDRLLNPAHKHEKEYRVEVDRRFTPGFLLNMQEGVELSDGVTARATAKAISDTVFSITLTEGRNRQIRRMTEKLGYTVRDLKRTRIQNILLGNLAPNAAREITGAEKEEFLKSIGLE
jgi:23S rRNA pseudouridine2604 synthase